MPEFAQVRHGTLACDGYGLLMGADGDESDFRVLVVCNANQFRSPLAEHLLRTRARALGLRWVIESAGTTAKPDQMLNAAVTAQLSHRAIPADPEWRSQRLSPSLLGRADLILVAERAQRRAVAELSPAALRRTFLLAQFARLAAASDSADRRVGAALITAVRATQPTLQPVPAEVDTVADPAGQPPELLAACANRIAAIVDQLLPMAPTPTLDDALPVQSRSVSESQRP